MVLHRMIDLGKINPLYPQSVYLADNGDKYKKMVFYDFNSLYPYAFQQSLPTGPGLAFQKAQNGKFCIKSMHQSGKNSSLEAVEWLEVTLYFEV